MASSSAAVPADLEAGRLVLDVNAEMQILQQKPWTLAENTYMIQIVDRNWGTWPEVRDRISRRYKLPRSAEELKDHYDVLIHHMMINQQFSRSFFMQAFARDQQYYFHSRDINTEFWDVKKTLATRDTKTRFRVPTPDGAMIALILGLTTDETITARNWVLFWDLQTQSMHPVVFTKVGREYVLSKTWGKYFVKRLGLTKENTIQIHVNRYVDTGCFIFSKM